MVFKAQKGMVIISKEYWTLGHQDAISAIISTEWIICLISQDFHGISAYIKIWKGVGSVGSTEPCYHCWC